MEILKRAGMTEGLLPVSMVLFFVELVRGAYLGSFLPTYVTNGLGLSVTTVGAAVTAHFVMDTFTKSFLGHLLDRFSSRKVVFGGLLISMFGLFMTYGAPFAWLVIAGAGVFGIGISPVWIVALSTVKASAARATQMGALYTLWLAGLGAGPILLNFFLDKGYHLSFWLMVAFWVLGWLLSLRLADQTISEVETPSFAAQFRALWLRLRTMRPLLPGMMLQTTAASMLVPILPSYAAHHVGLSYSQYSYVLLAGGFCAVIAMVPMGRLSDRRGRKWFLVGGFAGFALTLYALTMVRSLRAAILVAIVLGLSYAAVLPVWNAVLSYQVPDDQQGLGWGVFSSVEGIGVMIGPILGGRIADLYSETGTVVVSATLLGILAVFYLLFPFSHLIRGRRRRS
ncbi:MFS transporter [Kyrpidia spormannii]|uniref:MFS transporter n=1 Tax=Kyrpidia spormannii TaxID=2055160 RepID=A0A6F9EFX9_9BACL|nr:MFS transporter [Kyrpidia spormannii]CAB3395846.1 MFS transporter [Kyrpidia spormannii]HHY68228.1 MFS transporter [Alicyclobacillus sp.]